MVFDKASGARVGLPLSYLADGSEKSKRGSQWQGQREDGDCPEHPHPHDRGHAGDLLHEHA
jgi:hypothetical protein